jgi:aspartate 1-decarboxylase
VLREFCLSKIHHARVTQADLHYEGSLTVDEDLLDAAGIALFEKVQVVNVNNGARFETYTIPGIRGSRVVCLNGPAARLGQVGDMLIIITYGLLNEEEARDHKPKVIVLDDDNNIKDIVIGQSMEIQG